MPHVDHIAVVAGLSLLLVYTLTVVHLYTKFGPQEQEVKVAITQE